MSDSQERSQERDAEGSRKRESYVRTNERTNEELANPAQIPHLGERTREDDSDSEGDSSPQYEPVPPHPKDIPAHHRKPEMQRLRAIVRTAGAKIPKKEVTE